MSPSADPRSQRLSELSAVAHRLGLAFGAEAERAEGWERRIQFFSLFERCFFAVRVATALELRMLREARLAGRAQATDDERPDREAAERGDWNEGYTERDREDDRERASLPLLLSTLEGVAADAEALPGPKPAELPTLRELLARMRSAPAAAAPTAGPSLRSRLSSSGASATLTLDRPPSPGPSALLPTRRATGPPRPR